MPCQFRRCSFCDMLKEPVSSSHFPILLTLLTRFDRRKVSCCSTETNFRKSFGNLLNVKFVRFILSRPKFRQTSPYGLPCFCVNKIWPTELTRLNSNHYKSSATLRNSIQTCLKNRRKHFITRLPCLLNYFRTNLSALKRSKSNNIFHKECFWL